MILSCIIPALVWSSSASSGESPNLFLSGEAGAVGINSEGCYIDCKGILESTPYVSAIAGAGYSHVEITVAATTTSRKIAKIGIAQVQLDYGPVFVRGGRISMPFGNFLPAQQITAPSQAPRTSSFLIPLHDVLGVVDKGVSLELRGKELSASVAAFTPQSISLTEITQVGVIGDVFPDPDTLNEARNLLQQQTIPIISPLLAPLFDEIFGLDILAGQPLTQTSTRRIFRRAYSGNVSYSTGQWGISYDAVYATLEGNNDGLLAQLLSWRYAGSTALLNAEAVTVGSGSSVKTRGVDMTATIPLGVQWAWYAQGAKFTGGVDASELATGILWHLHSFNVKGEIRHITGAGFLGSRSSDENILTLGTSYSFRF